VPRRATYKCPKCNSTNIVPIVYGYPGPKMIQDSDEGKIYLGGCEIKVKAPNRYCNDCEDEWNKTDNYNS
tara:strand:- start:4040 stop:4249 length:210 start_codon:yes stop_codon:yes gene_type:complete